MESMPSPPYYNPKIHMVLGVFSPASNILLEDCVESDEMTMGLEREISRLSGRETVENMKTRKQDWLL